MKHQKAKKTVSKLVAEFKKIRKEKGLSHEKLANLAGLTRSAISMIESEQRTPTILTCLKIAEALEVSLGDLLKEVSKS